MRVWFDPLGRPPRIEDQIAVMMLRAEVALRRLWGRIRGQK